METPNENGFNLSGIDQIIPEKAFPIYLMIFSQMSLTSFNHHLLWQRDLETFVIFYRIGVKKFDFILPQKNLKRSFS